MDVEDIRKAWSTANTEARSELLTSIIDELRGGLDPMGAYRLLFELCPDPDLSVLQRIPKRYLKLVKSDALQPLVCLSTAIDDLQREAWSPLDFQRRSDTIVKIYNSTNTFPEVQRQLLPKLCEHCERSRAPYEFLHALATIEPTLDQTGFGLVRRHLQVAAPTIPKHASERLLRLLAGQGIRSSNLETAVSTLLQCDNLDPLKLPGANPTLLRVARLMRRVIKAEQNTTQ